MNWQKSLKNVGTLVKKKKISHILGDFNIYPDSYPAMSQNKFVGYPCNKMQSNFAPMSIS